MEAPLNGGIVDGLALGLFDPALVPEAPIGFNKKRQHYVYPL